MAGKAFLILAAVIAVAAALPIWGYSQSWGYSPAGVTALILLILVVLAFLRRI